MPVDVDALREAASHRGLKLVKSRKRTSGTGDFGKFGLEDAAGKPLIGFGEKGLTASLEQIDAFLRKGDASTWAASATIPSPGKSVVSQAKSGRAVQPADEPAAIGVAQKRRAARPSRAIARDGMTSARKSTSADVAEIRPQLSPKRVSSTAPPPEPKLVVRKARAADGKELVALFALLGGKVSERDVGRALAAATSRKEPVFVADRGSVVGCLAWHVVPTVQHGGVARITALIVAVDDRGRGVGRLLYETALAEFRKRGVKTVEAMSDIEVRNANGFYRALGLQQASYRFAAEI